MNRLFSWLALTLAIGAPLELDAQIEPVVATPHAIRGTEARNEQDSAIDYDKPVACDCQDQCEALWVEAVSMIQSLTGMRLRTTTDFMLETFVSQDGISGTVVKSPLGKGAYEIKASISVPGRGDAAYSGRRAFNADMALRKSNFQCPASS